MEDTVDPAVGFVITAKPGRRVDAGEPLATIHARDTAGLAHGRRTLDAAITIGEEPPEILPLLGARVT
jgi:thymidine phosphorylase